MGVTQKGIQIGGADLKGIVGFSMAIDTERVDAGRADRIRRRHDKV